jgi:medium-chain acyl-[acyl-carrier-protein] hydrolase
MNSTPSNQALAGARGRPRLVSGGNNWIVRFGAEKPAAAFRLFVFPHAGGGPADYRDWSIDCPEDVDVVGLQLPGRGMRFQESLLTNMDQLIESLGDALISCLDRPFAFFGHSLGGRIAFAAAQRLKALGLPSPRLLAVSSSRAPGACGRNVSNLSDEAFRLHLQDLGGTPQDLLNDEELMELMLPVLRADFLLHDSLVASPALLDCPILACGGLDDREVAESDLDRWRNFTDQTFTLRLFPGGHFYLREHRRRLVSALLEQTISARPMQ